MIPVLLRQKLIGYLDAEIQGRGIRVPIAVSEYVFSSLFFKWCMVGEEIGIRIHTKKNLEIFKKLSNFNILKRGLNGTK